MGIVPSTGRESPGGDLRRGAASTAAGVGSGTASDGRGIRGTGATAGGTCSETAEAEPGGVPSSSSRME